MVARRAFGGGIDVQAWIGVATIATTICFILAVYNIKKLQVEQHRAWMLRGWFIVYHLHYARPLFTDRGQAGAVITSRIVLCLATVIISSIESYYISWPCVKIEFTLKTHSEAEILDAYPKCAAFFNGTNPLQEDVVHANFNSVKATEIGAAMNMTFGTALWVATVLHVVGVEIYVGGIFPIVTRRALMMF